MSDAEDKQVREKLVLRGVGALTDAELISIVFQEGTRGTSALTLAERLMDRTDGSLIRLQQMPLQALRQTEGIGMKKAALLAAALELGRRLEIEQQRTPVTIASNEDVIRLFRHQIAVLPHEEFWVLFLSSANTVLGKMKVSQGGVSGTVVDYRLIVKRAVELLASGMILVHNHPSGVARPSEEDKTLTEEILRAASLFNIIVLDHLIITSGECFSFRQQGLIG